MKQDKKRLNVVPPTLRDKKRYISFSFTKAPQEASNEQELSRIIIKNFEKVNGLFKSIKANISLIWLDKDKKEVLIRVNKDNLDELITSLFFLKYQFGLIKINGISQTIKKGKGK
jgi:RNase P/RNase MRP subunit POP5